VVTVGVPVSDAGGKVRAVVLLHSPVQGMREAAWEGIRILILSCVVAMVLVFVLSMLFSWKFTKPLNKMRLVAEKMSEHDYTERCNIDQKDEIGQLAQTLDGLGERLLEADQASKKLEQLRRDFIANISHELRTPVTVIRGSLEALCDRIVTEPQEVEDYHRQMLAETLFLQRLINDLLDLSRLQNTDFPIEKEPVNLCDVVQDVVRSSQRLGQQKNITIQLSLDTPVYIIEGDYGRLRQMLLIFLDNSIKFSPEQSKIEVTLLGSRLTVTDHGCGVKQEELPHVFDRFYKTRGETNKSGSGLGLAISKQISERHGIGLTMTSIPGEATSVVLQLPPALKKGSTD
jgi:signal transduction histidine kinase